MPAWRARFHYGDVAPQSVPGQMLASIVMILGYGIIAVHTGIVTVEISEARRRAVSSQACPEGGAEGHEPNARFCNRCGAQL